MLGGKHENPTSQQGGLPGDMGWVYGERIQCTTRIYAPCVSCSLSVGFKSNSLHTSGASGAQKLRVHWIRCLGVCTVAHKT
jgi:hypothetical protein